MGTPRPLIAQYFFGQAETGLHTKAFTSRTSVAGLIAVANRALYEFVHLRRVDHTLPNALFFGYAEQAGDPIKIVEGIVIQYDTAGTLALTRMDRHFGLEHGFKSLLKIANVRRTIQLRRFVCIPVGGPPLLLPPYNFLHRPHGKIVFNDRVRQATLHDVVLHAEQTSGVPHAKSAKGDLLPYRIRKVQQPQIVGDGRAVLAHPFSHFLSAEPETIAESSIGLGPVDGIEILTLQILNEGQLKHLLIGGLPDKDRNLLQV